MAKKLMLGNHAVARGLYEAGVSVVSSYPGTPSTEITEHASNFDREHMWVEWAPNEKVAVETAIGASIAGTRAFSAMKHVGLNVAADPLFTSSYTGVTGGLVFAVADDPGMHSSQNEQDSRHYAIAAKVPMLEPADSLECKEFTKLAFELSENFDTPVLLRLSTRVSHSQSAVEEGERIKRETGEYKKNAVKYVMMPSFARAKHVLVEQRTQKLIDFAETSSLNTVEINSEDIGVITSGIAYHYSKEAFGNKASYLKLGLINPLPVKLILDFASRVKKLYVIEELDDVIESHCRKIGLSPLGKELFTYIGEYSGSYLREKIFGEKTEFDSFGETVPNRPPVLCAGCPHRGVFYTLQKLKVTVSGDIGCYTLGASPPLSAMDTTVCMGASISGLHGFNKARFDFSGRSVAVIGDSTFIHSGITGLINIVYNKSNSTIIILDNSITGMTGHQNNPANGYNIYGDFAVAVDLEALVRSIGVNRVTVIDPNDLNETERIIKQELSEKEPSVIIARMPCALLKSVKYKHALAVDADKCKSCKMCTKLGCPAIIFKEKAEIDPTLCVGCGLCGLVCKFSAINRKG
ncbi:MAG: indolepyruvate ferredoxin oxidoreductase subunit alpha [Eubacterium sp.]|jgi:indolepyruvate ferredoxin oxidoreductase alpha subunit|nr:indolepyruvate ferredoxin oxidoreductase subunit alpha [Eubacterium sp.]